MTDRDKKEKNGTIDELRTFLINTKDLDSAKSFIIEKNRPENYSVSNHPLIGIFTFSHDEFLKIIKWRIRDNMILSVYNLLGNRIKNSNIIDKDYCDLLIIQGKVAMILGIEESQAQEMN